MVTLADQSGTRHFRFHGTKVLGFKKSPLGQTIYRELCEIIRLETPDAPPAAAPAPPPTGQAGTESDMSAV